MPMPRKSDEYKKRIGTYRADRSETLAEAEPENDALAEYRHRLHTAFASASHGDPVDSDITFLQAAEDALRRYGIADRNGSALVELAAHRRP